MPYYNVPSLVRFPIFFALILAALLSAGLSACLSAKGQGNGESEGAASSPTQNGEAFGDSTIIAYKNSSVALFDANTGKNVATHNFAAKLYPFKSRQISGADGAKLLTWADENASIHSALCDADINVLLSKRDASPSASFDSRIALGILDRPGAEGTSLFSTEIWNAATGKVEKKYSRASVLESESGRFEGDFSIVMSGPASEKDIDVYGNTTHEQVSRFDMKTGDELFSTAISKDYGSSFTLIAASQDSVVLLYDIDVLREELVCLGPKGKVAWRKHFNVQFGRIPVFPFQDALSGVICAFDPIMRRLVFYVVPAPGAGRVFAIDTWSGETVWSREFSRAAISPDKIEFESGQLQLYYGYGRSILTLDADTGETLSEETSQYSSTPIKSEIEIREFMSPFGITLVAGERDLTVDYGNGKKWLIPLTAFGGRIPEAVSFGGENGMIIRIKFEGAMQSNDVTPGADEALLDAKARKIIIGDQLNREAWIFYGRSKIVIAGDKLAVLGEGGKPAKTTPLFDNKP